MRILLAVTSLIILVNFGIYNDIQVWMVVNTLFVVIPILYLLFFYKSLDKTVASVLILIGIGTVYQIAIGKGGITTPDPLWQIIDVVGVFVYAYLAGSDLKICSCSK